MSASLGMTLNTTSPNTYNLDLFNAERHTTGGHPNPSTCCSYCCPLESSTIC